MLYRIDKTAGNLTNQTDVGRAIHGGVLVPVEPDYEAAVNTMIAIFDEGAIDFGDDTKRIVDAALKGDT